MPSDLYSHESTIQILDRLCYSNRKKKYVFQRKVKELKKKKPGKNARNKNSQKKKKNETAIEVILEWIDL